MTDQATPMERRLVLRLLAYWRGLGGEDRLPAEADIDPDAMADMWAHCMVLDVGSGVADPVILRAGDSLAATAGSEVAGRRLSSVPADSLLAVAARHLDQVLAKRVPITMGGELRDWRAKTLLYRSIILPLAADGATIDRLLCAANCRELPSR